MERQKLNFVTNIRAAFRLARIGLHLLWGVATVALAFPLLPRGARLWLKVRWSRQLLNTLGVRLLSSGTPPGGALLVANHISWLDVYAINALLPTTFVSKDDVRGWPVIGWLSAQTGTVFMERGSRNAAMRTKERLTDELQMHNCVSIFPEGTTGYGDSVMPFHGALFQSAIDAGAHVAPAVLQYSGPNGEPSRVAAYVGDISLWQSLRAIVTASDLAVHVCFLPTIDSDGQNRRHLAHQAQHRIHSYLDKARAGMRLQRCGVHPQDVGDGRTQLT
ncbi:putative 1-acylglycerol-3-phosphate O-acyltransferase [Georgfuchsia toluolica]|uniref:1-acylglycerol-3-phosphate O-acyltransferase n=1 Tax=Georgfuchsia toluolica TaxID=424218 RepID=A0A916MZ34_9PROT|nr:lysophospholipid acyltransferase family protein [Georgfuchsia toluolica]CAG4882514.1 putative 1-acylglycerol-3-phosphate O-acyltransferase [Georgfuchsia toluolica]